MSVLVVFANQTGFASPIGVVMAWKERGSCLNIFRKRNCGRISETFTNYKAKDLLRKNLHELQCKRRVVQVSETLWFALYLQTGVVLMLQLESSWHGRSVDHVLTYSGLEINVGSQRPSRITRQNTCCANEKSMSDLRNLHELRGKRLVVQDKSWSDLRNHHELRGKGLVAHMSETHRFALYLRTGVDLMLELELSWHGRSVDHVLAYSGRQIVVGSLKPSRITRQNTCCASERNTSVRVVFADRSGFDAPIGVVMAWEEGGSCLNIFRTRNHGQISETFTNYEVKDLSRNRHGIGGAWTWLKIFRMTNRGRISETFTKYEAKHLLRKQNTPCASELNTSVRVVFENRSGFDAPIGVIMAWEQRGSCLNIFRKTNRGRISETFTNYEVKDLLRNRHGIGGASTCLNIFWMKNCGRISETLTNYEAKDLLRKNLNELRGKRLVVQVSEIRRFALYLRTGVVLMLQLELSRHGRSVDHVLTYSGGQIAVGSQKPSRITMQKTCCANERNTSVRVVFANRSGFVAPIGVVMGWVERGLCLNIFRTTNHCRISETCMNYEAKDFFRK
ncbi:uncharacterized protein G2W53_026436 [Senna tora]|uniref:Uncharacterized protein n=1 Tax=Senna tora TaxID=362788 RepID=A0A834TH01_9FABA|nr:uncharacterized protein G2W53_026436 [Senna tora]